ncbi:MAG: LuxR C-terminal-related transcriptional regulator [Candidatus Dormibacteria bacterium]
MTVARETAPSVERSAAALFGAAMAERYHEDKARAASLLEQAHAAAVREGEIEMAVMAAAGLMINRSGAGEYAAARGWEQRGLRLLADRGDCLARGYLALGFAGCDIHDPRELLERADIAYRLAKQFGDRQLELRALAERGLALVCQGNVDDGFALLDEVMVGVVAGDFADAGMRGLAICSVLSACERTGDTGRAEYWLSVVESGPKLHEIGITTTHCQVVHGVVDALCGRWADAETHLQQAMTAPLTAAYHHTNSTAKLAELKIQQGKYDEADKLLRGLEGRVEAAPAAAHLAMARGDHARAAALLRSVVRNLGTDCMRQAPAFALLVEAQLRCGDVEAARRSAHRLLALHEGCSSNEIRALGHLTSARLSLHENDSESAIDELETALTLLIHLDRPLLTAQIRLELGRALVQCGDAAGARVEVEAAIAVFERLGIVPDVAAARSLIEGIDATNGHAPAPSHASVRHPLGAQEQLTPREREIAQLVGEGLTNREIAKRLFLSVRTAETHVDRALGKLGFHTRSQLAAWVARQQQPAGA